MRCEDSHVHSSAEEEIAAEESFSRYCLPVEFYNILKWRATRNPPYLERCLLYKRQAKQKKRIQMTIAVDTECGGSQTHSFCPMFVLLARTVSNSAMREGEYSTLYCFRQARLVTSLSAGGAMTRAQADFILPEINKLAAQLKSEPLAILFVSCAEVANSLNAIGPTENQNITTFPSNFEGHCLLGKISMQSLHLTLEKSLNLNVGERADVVSTVHMHSCFMKFSGMDGDKHIAVWTPSSSGTLDTPKQVEVIICAKEAGPKEKSHYDLYSYNKDIAMSSFIRIIKLRTGNVLFNYSYYNNKLHKTEVTEDFSCPFCLVKCASFKGLECHLSSSHDLLKYEFWVSEHQQVVNVSLKPDIKRLEQSTNFKARLMVHAFLMALSSDGADRYCSECNKPNANVTGTPTGIAHSHGDPECIQSISGGESSLSTRLKQCGSMRKSSMGCFDPRNRALLEKRQFFHSRKLQPMALEDVISDHDSEDEVDHDIEDLEDCKMLQTFDFTDVTEEETQIVLLWNSFVRRQRVLVDGHVPWACEAFTKLHSQKLVREPSLLWSWRLFMIKLWNHSLLDAQTMNNCNIIIEKLQNKGDVLIDEDKEEEEEEDIIQSEHADRLKNQNK
ncbi:polycomb group protein EMBRYONIC FLOWER 2 [Diospyros lotus]|uniref:polycomb group protein EMBRYONIC FLOWER 2 n=1 Tax=Diospyros lotus TaxID=55363 RepID=UPI0022564BAC|nr:polycomb group protein EMBRYONIC FLOWER 2 [Diospyros lotus]